MNATLPVYNAAGPTQALALRSGSVEAVRAALLAARRRTLALADAVHSAMASEYPSVPYAPELNPPLWELGHVAWFQEWWIARNSERGLGWTCNPDAARSPSLLPKADAWYDSSRVPHASRWHLPIPDADATRDYLNGTLDRTLRLLDELPASASDEALYFYRLVMLHEAMHVEAATYMAESLGLDLGTTKDTGVDLEIASTEQVYTDCVELDLAAQLFRVGSDGSGFAFDNELQSHDVSIKTLAMDAHAVNWARFLPFVEGGGYERHEYWSEEGQAWLAGRPWRHPSQLRLQGGRWQARRGGQWLSLDPQRAAVHLSVHEAEAWCRWAGRRLPTEAEWECACLTLPGFSWGQVWEWTATTFEAYPGFVAHPYRDYSAPWFGTRRVLRGACAATSPWLAHARYRNFFEAHRTDIFSGFRSVRTNQAPSRVAV